MKASNCTARGMLVFLFSTATIAAVFVPPLCTAEERVHGTEAVWQIGKDDQSYLEFAECQESVFHKPDYRNLFPKDVHFVVGKHRDADWSPVHPGPDDFWAEGKAHKFVIEFDYDAEPRPMALTILLVDAHYGQPPVLTIDFNGLEGRFVTQRGVGGNEVARDPTRGKRQAFTLHIPTTFVKKGKNVVSIINDEGSWAFYDCLKLVAPVGPPPCVIPVDITCGPRLDSRGKAVILLEGNIFYWGKPAIASLQAIQNGKVVKITPVPAPEHGLTLESFLEMDRDLAATVESVAAFGDELAASVQSVLEGKVPKTKLFPLLEEGVTFVSQQVPAGPETEFVLVWNTHKTALAKASAMTPQEIRRIESQQYFARLASLYPENSFYSYAAVQTAKMEGDAKALSELKQRWQPFEFERPARREADLYSMTTGLLSIQESLQLDAMLRGAPLIEDKTVPVEELKPPQTRSLPFTEMLGDKEPAFSALAAMVPEDQYYIHFRSVGHALAFMDFVDTWGEHCLKHYGLSAKKAMTREKLEKQMCLKDIWFARPFANLAAGEVVVTGGHPFVAQGDDLSIIAEVKIRSLFNSTLERFVEKAKKSRPDAREERFSLGQHDVYGLVTPDSEISHYRADLGTQTVISNSKEALRRILQTADSERASLVGAPDFQYMRSIFKQDDPAESGFVFLSESFIRRQIGPAAKIAQARRLQCGTVLKMIANAAILFKHLNGRFPNSLKEMLDSQCIDSRYLVCQDGGEYSWEAGSLSGVCSVHNRLRYLTPIVELKTDLASEREREEYKRFVERYNNYWRRFFDPVGIRVSMSSSGLTLETLILPLVENSIYRTVTEFSGGKPVELAPKHIHPQTILSIEGRVPGSFIRKFFDGILEWWRYGGREEERVRTADEELAFRRAASDVRKAFGNKASLNFCDDPMLFGVQAAEVGGLPMRGMGGMEIGIAAAVLGLNFPVYASVEVPDPEAADRFLSFVASRLAWQRRNGAWFDTHVNLYEVAPYRERKIYVIEGAIGPVRLRGFVCILGNEAYGASRLSLLKEIIDLAERGESAAAEQSMLEGNVAVLIRPKAWRRVKEDFRFAWAATAREACLANLDELHVLHSYFSDVDLPMEKVAENADGTRYFCPEGGKYEYDREKNVVACSVHGMIDAQRQPEGMREEASFSRLISGIDRICLSLAFESEGVRTIVTINFNEEYRPFGQ